jgi:hypothetical protein
MSNQLWRISEIALLQGVESRVDIIQVDAAVRCYRDARLP